MTAERAPLAPRLLAWWDVHGRRDLPWQREPSPYRVWVSEVMLQQTQVVTVIPYFERFVARLPDVAALAAAGEDEVLHLWTGLGYYARARNLQRAARQVMREHGGELPGELAALMALPGIGRSTAGAILALSAGQRHAILDGNAKRVLARWAGIAGDPGQAAVARALWAAAERETPATRVRDYTQAVMDLGATLCTRRAPACARCPLRGDCVAFGTGRIAELPGRARRSLRATRQRTLLVLRQAGAVLLEKRPSPGLWGGLWSLPELASGESAADWLLTRFGRLPTATRALPGFTHDFSHFRLAAEPLEVWIEGRLAEPAPDRLWYDLSQPPHLGLPRPIQILLADLGAKPLT